MLQLLNEIFSTFSKETALEVQKCLNVKEHHNSTDNSNILKFIASLITLNI